MRDLCGHKGKIYSMSMSDDGRILVSVGCDKNLFLWDMMRGIKLAQYQGHTEWIFAAAISWKTPKLCFDYDPIQNLKNSNLYPQKCLYCLKQQYNIEKFISHLNDSHIDKLKE